MARHTTVDRQRLVSRLNESDAPLAVLSAPAGYGKSTLLAEWEQADGRPFASVALERRHNDPTFLVASIALALDQIDSVGEDIFAALATPSPRILEVVIPRLGEALHAKERAVVVALDDAHVVGDQDAVKVIEALHETLPVGSVLALSSRVEPRIHLGRLRASGLVLELGAGDLTMTNDEAACLLRACGLDLTEVAVGRLVERTEGWPAGLYLAALALLADDDVDGAIARFAGDDRLVADYLRDEFLSSLDPDELDFLTRTSILDPLSGPVCDAVLERQGSREILRRLSRSNLLMVPLDRTDETFRSHALLRDMLRTELRGQGERVEHELHRRASGWHHDHGDMDRAVAHAIRAQDLTTAGQLIWKCTPGYASGGREATLRRWLGEFTDEQIVSSAFLCMSRAVTAIVIGDGAATDHWTANALQAAESMPPAEREPIETMVRVLRAIGVAADGMARMGEDAAEAFALLPEDDPWRSACRMVEGVACQLSGDLARARPLLEDGARRGSAVGRHIETLCLAQLALLEIDEGNTSAAADLAADAVSKVARFGLDDLPTSATIFAISALTLATQGTAAEAMRDAHRSARMLDELNHMAPWFEAEDRVVLARALLLMDDISGSREQLGRAGQVLSQIPDASALRESLEAAWLEIDRASSKGGRWPLTAAEIRLLHFLPTHLSFKEIADECFVSPNTVKAQAKSLYRKFGVGSRAEAVACARSAGLLGSRDGSDQQSGNPAAP